MVLPENERKAIMNIESVGKPAIRILLLENHSMSLPDFMKSLIVISWVVMVGLLLYPSMPPNCFA